eukprot:2386752-Alexandrium_andersonii.AAC.1
MPAPQSTLSAASALQTASVPAQAQDHEGQRAAVAQPGCQCDQGQSAEDRVGETGEASPVRRC